VKLLLTIVPFVLPEELTHQNVSVQKDNMPTKLIPAECVTINVKLVLNMVLVLNVLKNLSEFPQISANVTMVTMIITRLNVNHVPSNVKLVKNTTSVLPVLV